MIKLYICCFVLIIGSVEVGPDIDMKFHQEVMEIVSYDIEQTHHSFTANNSKINVIVDSKKLEKKQAFAKTDRKLPVVIPACTEMTVRTTTTKTKYPFEALVEPNPRSLPAGLDISLSFQIVEDGQICVQVSNYTEEDIYIPSNQKLAKVTLAEEVIPEYEMGVDNTGKKIVYLQE